MESDGRVPLARKASMLNCAFFLYLEARSAPNLISSFAWTISWGIRGGKTRVRVKGPRVWVVWSKPVGRALDVIVSCYVWGGGWGDLGSGSEWR